MARIARVVMPHFPHHITQRGSRGQQTFFSSKDYEHYISLVSENAKRFGVKIWAYCLMPNHVHLVAVPENEKSLSRCFSVTHRRYACHVNKRHGWQGHLWQQRFFSCVMDEYHLMVAVRYIELNPVRAKLCHSPFDWPWSSARTHLKRESNQLITTKSMLGHVDNWACYLCVDEKQVEIEKIRKYTRTGRPAGDRVFLEKISNLSGRTLIKLKPGPRRTN